jgi:RTX calcium-binding nonapeptide repeat (4 copies)
MVGNSGRDLLVGGIGADRIVGNADDDIMIAGRLNFADQDAAVSAIMAEWTSSRDYTTRVANLRPTFYQARHPALHLHRVRVSRSQRHSLKAPYHATECA